MLLASYIKRRQQAIVPNAIICAIVGPIKRINKGRRIAQWLRPLSHKGEGEGSILTCGWLKRCMMGNSQGS